ncbi:hypothetical protein PTKIN_Ptkin07bG0077600 [Pterospermum kingtungense]
MEEELSDMWRSLSLTEDEEIDIEAEDSLENESTSGGRNWLVGKLVTSRPFNKEAMMGTMKAIWKLNREVEIMTLEENLFLFKFQGKKDKARVLDGAPWTFDKHLLLFHEFKAIKIGKRIGKLESTDESLDEGGWSNFLRLNVKVNITKPLRRTVKLIGGDEKTKI